MIIILNNLLAPIQYQKNKINHVKEIKERECMFLLLSYCRRYKAECLNPNEWFFMTSVTIHWATVDVQCKATIRRSYLHCRA